MSSATDLEATPGGRSSEELLALLESKCREIERLKQLVGSNAKLKSAVESASLRAREAKSVDACFVFDCTSSMRTNVEAAKQKINAIQEYILASLGHGSSVRFGLVAFRDYTDEQQFEILPFTDNVQQVRGFLARCQVQGGGDPCEDVIGGLEQAVLLDWQASSRILYLLCDSPSHGRRFHDSDGLDDSSVQEFDSYPNDPKQWAPADLVHAQMVQLRLHFVGMTFSKHCEKMFRVFSNLRDIGGDHGLSTLVLKPDGSAKDFVQCVLEGTRSSLSNSLTLVSSPQWSLAAQDSEPHGARRALVLQELCWADWECWPQQQVLVTALTAVGRRGTAQPNCTARVLHIRELPFAKGSMRYAFPAVDERGSKMVVKVYQFEGNRWNSREAVWADVLTQTYAQIFATEFSRRMPTMPLQFVHNYIMEASHWILNVIWPYRFSTLEDFIPGLYQKYTSNSGFSGSDSSLAAACSHFTWHLSSGDMMVTDIQGVGSAVLTDPQIHCEGSTYFGKGNLGNRGMDNFFMRHSCGEICTALGLTRSPLQMGDAEITEAGTASHEPRTLYSSDLDSSLSSVMSAPGALDGLLTRSLSSLRSDAIPRSSGSLLCSGPLLCEARCGGAVEASGDKYLKHLRKYGGIYCESCKLQVKDSMCRAPCQSADCKEHVFYSVFVLGITGTAAPTSCRHCRALECWTLIERVDETDSVE